MTAEAPDLGRPGPQHVAIIMDGNGRWAKARKRPRVFGHEAGRRAVRRAVRAAHRHGVKVLTLFAFSQENWQRPPAEVALLMKLFAKVLDGEVERLHRNGVRMRFIGDHSPLSPELRAMMAAAVEKTRGNDQLTLVTAVGYGGQQDIANAAQALCREGSAITPEAIESRLSLAEFPHPDLLIRTGGEKRISNFLLWQLAYAELYFVDTLWPDFADADFAAAVDWYAGRERRFGRVPEGA